MQVMEEEEEEVAVENGPVEVDDIHFSYLASE